MEKRHGVLMMLQNPHIDTKLQRPFELPTSDSEVGSPWKNRSLEVQAVPGLLGSGRNARRIASRADVPRCQCRAYGGEEPIVESSHSDHCAAAAQNRFFVRRLMKDRRVPRIGAADMKVFRYPFMPGEDSVSW